LVIKPVHSVFNIDLKSKISLIKTACLLGAVTDSYWLHFLFYQYRIQIVFLRRDRKILRNFIENTINFK
jgi:hypothetical protein